MDVLAIILFILVIVFIATAIAVTVVLFVDEMRWRSERRQHRLREEEAFYKSLGRDRDA